MSFLQTYAKEILSILVPLVIWTLNNFFKARAKLILAKPHAFSFLIQEPLLSQEGQVIRESQNVQTISHLVINSGRESATNVELTFNWKPMYLNLWPVRRFEEHTNSDRRYTIVFDSFAPGESITCELLSINQDLPTLLTVRSEQCVAKEINMQPQPIVGNWFRRAIIFILFLGISTAIYWSITILQFLILNTPL